MFRFTLPRLFAGIAVVALWAWVVGHFYRNQKAEQNLHDLVRGDQSISFSSLTIENQMRRVICTDPKLLAYFSNCFRQSDPHILPGGYTHQITFGFGDGSKTSITSCWSNIDGIGLSIPSDKPSELGLTTRGVIFQKPIPAEITELLEFFEKPSVEVKGKVLILQSGGNRWDFDPQL